MNDTIRLHLPQLLNEHFLRNSRDRPFEVGEAQYFAAEEMKEDDQLPPTLQNFECILDTLSGADRLCTAYLSVCTLLFRAFLSFRNLSLIFEFVSPKPADRGYGMKNEAFVVARK